MRRGGRILVRSWRRLRRPSLGRLAAVSLGLHLTALALVIWVVQPATTPLPLPPPPLIVELPPGEPGRPAVRPETPTRAARPAPAPPVVTARPAPPPPSPPRAAPPEPVPAPPAPTPPPPAPSVTRPAEPPAPPSSPVEPPTVPAPPSPPPAPVTPAPEPAPAPPPPVVAATPPEPAPASPPPAVAATPPEPAPASPPPAVAARPPEPAAPAPPARPAEPAPREGPAESPLSSQVYSLLRPKIDLPPLPGPRVPGGGKQPEGEGAGGPGARPGGQDAVPLNTPDPRYADYFPEIKKRIQDHWVYPTEAARKDQSGQLVLEFVIRKDGRVPIVELVRSSGFEILDRYALNAVRLAAPFPAIPDQLKVDEIRINANFTYILDHGFRIFGLK